MDKKVIHSVFEEVSVDFAEKVAIETEDDAVTYRELNIYANRLSHLLISIFGGTGKIVTVLMPSSVRLVGALISVFKRGGIYLPFELSFPLKRLQQIFGETFDGIVVVSEELKDDLINLADQLNIEIEYLIVTGRHNEIELYSRKGAHLAAIPVAETPDWKNNPVCGTSGDSSNYIYYTSGSTGEGKAILGANVSLSHFIHWEVREFGVDASFRVSQLTRVTFDASLRDIMLPLVTGGTLCIPSAEVRENPIMLLDWLAEKRISLVHCVPSLFRILTKECQLHDERTFDFRHLRYILLAGELLYAKDIQEWRRIAPDSVRLVNLYGATETTLIKTFYRIEEIAEDPSAIIPVGMPISNTAIVIIKDNRACLAGQIGEIYIKSPFTTKGYYKNELLTGECFVQNPLLSDRKDVVYKTGDLGRYMPDGNLEVIGRSDSMVKINGVRVELGEVERAMLGLDTVSGVVVKTHQANDNSLNLVAYYTGNPTDVRLFRNALGEALIQQAIPSSFVHLNEFPLNSNGKIDRKALLLPENILTNDMGGSEPADLLESSLVQFWKEILGREKIGVNSSFFNLGGNSLRAIQLISRIYKKFGIKLKIVDIFSKHTIREQASLLSVNLKKIYQPINPAPSQTSYILSSSQFRLWALSQFEGGSIAYNMPRICMFQGELDLRALEFSFSTLLERHEILRTVFKENESGEINQFILSPEVIGFTIRQRDGRQEERRAVIQTATEEFTKPFDLAEGPLLRASLFRTGENEWIFSYVMHHIISDGWSMNVLIRELLLIYNSYIKGEGNPLPALRIQYKDYAFWQRIQLSEDRLTDHKAYWLQQFEGLLPVLQLSGDRPRPPVKTYNGGSVSKHIDAGVSNGIKKTCYENGATLFMGLLAAINVLLYKYTGQTDIIIGIPVAGREQVDLEEQIGLYVNTLALRTRFSDQDNYQHLLGNIKEVSLQAYEHQSYPFDELVNELNIRRDVSRSPLFDVLVVLQNPEDVKTADTLPENLTVKRHEGVSGVISKFDLTFVFEDRQDGMSLIAEYNSDIYDRDFMLALTGHLEQLMKAAVELPLTPLLQLNYLSDTARHRLLNGFNETQARYADDKTIPQLFQEQAGRTPDKIALVSDEMEMTYEELERRSNQFAAYLRENYCVRPDDLFGVKLYRSEWMLVVILGILKSGGAYVPIDPDYPAARADYILTDSGCKALIDDDELNRFRLRQENFSTNAPAFINTPDNLAYVIYTSGSTGRPKGCMLEHRGLINRLEWMWNQFGFDGQDIILQKTTYTFDVSVWELLMPLCWGASLVICKKEDAGSPDRILEFIKKHKVTCLHFVPTMLAAFIAAVFGNQDTLEGLESLRCLITSGESLSLETVKRWYGRIAVPIYNLYGPTEASIDVTFYVTGPADNRVPIGRPIWNTQVYILDKANQPVPEGIAGELCIGGIGLARGYLNNPELTARKFVRNPFREGERMYRTGDLAKWLPDGNIEFLGRMDDQVKIRGYRIEPGEIESALQAHEAIDAAVVVASPNEDGERELTAYLVSSKKLKASDLRWYLSKSLPAYMLPAYYVQLENFPLTSSGKIDRQKLPDPTSEGLFSEASYIAPRSEPERALTEVFEEVLKKYPIGIKDNFFLLGGDSIKSIQVVSRLKRLGYSIPIRDVMLFPVIEEMASRLKTADNRIDQEAVEGTMPLSPVQASFLTSDNTNKHHFNQSVLLYSKTPVSEDALRAALNKILIHHDVLRMVYAESAEGWIQRNRGAEQSYSLEIIAETGIISFSAHCDRIQASLDLENGPLFKAALFRGEGGDRLLLVAHHLVMDGVSWRILFEDLSSLYQQYMSNIPLELPLKTNSFLDWQNKQTDYSRSPALKEEDEYWSAIESAPVMALPIENPVGSNLIKDTISRYFLLDEATTDLLLTKCYKAYQTEINDILLTGLCVALEKTFGMNKILINQEGHGRESMGSDIDISRTLGWFTTIYPVIFDMRHDGDLIPQLLDIRESLRKVPRNGIGYGILRYLGGKDYKLNPPIIFNYLGDFGASVETQQGSKVFEFCGDYHGQSVSGELKRNYALDISGMVVEGRLRITISYSRQQFSPESIGNLLHIYQQQVERLIEVLSGNKDEYPASDVLPDASYNQLFYFSEWDSRRAVVVSEYEFETLSMEVFQLALRRIIQRHEILRTVFVFSSAKIKQKVLPPDELDFLIPDHIHVVSDVELNTIIEKEKERVFKLSTPPLIVVQLFKKKDGKCIVLFTMHHVITDGYSNGILKDELTQLYLGILQDRDFRLPPLPTQYIDFSRWQKGFLESEEGRRHKEYWQKKLRGFNPHIKLPFNSWQVGHGMEKTSSVIIVTVIEGQFFEELDLFAKNNHLSRSAILMGGLSLLLSNLCSRDDITIAMPVSGRDSKYFEDMDIRSLIGYFVTILFVRNHIRHEISLIDYLQNVRDSFIDDLNFGIYPFTKLIEELPEMVPAKDLLDSLFFYNYHNYSYFKELEYGGDNSDPEIRTEDGPARQSHHGITVWEFGNFLKLEFIFSEKLLSRAQCESVNDLYFSIIKQFINEPASLLHDVMAQIGKNADLVHS